MANYSNSLSEAELRNEIKKILARDSARLANTNYSPYPGKTISPMSSLTQKARDIEEKASLKGIPYQKSLSRVANNPMRGISEDNLQNILANLKNKHLQFGQNVTGNRLEKQFGSTFDPYRNKYTANLNKDINLASSGIQKDIENLNTNIKNLEGKRNSAVFDTIANSSRGKNVRRQGLIGDLYKYGEQKHDITNKILSADKARFEAEKNEPHERLYNLQQALSGIDENEEHPDLSMHNAEQLKKALIAYGVDVGKPINEWGQGNSLHTPTYKGKLVEPLNPEMKASYKLAEEISPDYQDKNYNARKTLRKELVNSPDSMGGIVESLPEKLRPRFESLDTEAKKKAKADMAALNAKYIKRDMYGGQSHIKAASDRMREINDAAFGTKSKFLQNELGQGISASHGDTINKAQRLNQYDQLANTEFNDMLSDIKRTNTTGLEKWKNDQTGNEQLYKAYQTEKGHQQPRLLGNARATGAGMGVEGMLKHFSNQGVDLTSVSDLQNRYNNLEKELQTSNNKIKTQLDYQDMQKRLQEETARQNQLKQTEYENFQKLKSKQMQDARQTVPTKYNTPSYQSHVNNIRKYLDSASNFNPYTAPYGWRQQANENLANYIKAVTNYDPVTLGYNANTGYYDNETLYNEARKIINQPNNTSYFNWK